MNRVLRRAAGVARFFVCCVVWHGASAAAAAPSSGSLVIAGGALKADTSDVWSAIVTLAGGPGAPIAVFGSASEDPVGSASDAIAILDRYGAHAYFVPVATELRGADVRTAAHDPRNVALVARAGGVYFTGGDQGRITKALVDPSGQRSPVLDAVWKVFERGGVIAGSSAGAAIMSTTMFFEPRPTFEMLMDGARAGSDIAPGLGFVGPALFVDQHALARGRFARMIPAMLAAGYRIGLGIDENTAAIVGRDGRVTIAGRSGAVLVDVDHVRDRSSADPLRVAGVRIGLLRPGDMLDPVSHDVTPSPSRTTVAALGAGSGRTATIADPLGSDTLVDVMTMLADGAVREVVGDASSPGGHDDQRPAMRFRFRVSDATKVSCAEAPLRRDCTVVGVDLDVAPIDR